MSLRISFFGTSAFALPSLRRLAKGRNVALVVSRPPRRAGRGKRPRPADVAVEAKRLNLPLLEPETMVEAERAVLENQSDIGVVVDYGVLIPDTLLTMPRFGFINVHPSLLPRWRGAAPVERAILAGDQETGVSILRITSELDAGPLAAQRSVSVQPSDTGGGLRGRLAELGAEILDGFLDEVVAGRAAFHPQSERNATYADKINSAERKVNWRGSATAVARQVQALSPAPGAWCLWRGERLRLLAASAEDGHPAPPGTLVETRVACGKGWLRVMRVQPAGRGAMDAEAWLRGARATPEDRLE